MPATKKTNPLYVVSKNGKDVESVKNFLQLFLKKTGLDQVMIVLQTIIDMLLAQVQTYAVFIEVKKVIDNLLTSVLAILAL
jgi:hypothetical protein